MLKILGGLAVGFVIGAVALEIVTRRMPELVRRIEDEAERTVRNILGDRKALAAGEGGRS